MAFSLRMPRRFLRGGFGRLALTILALACGVALVGALDLVNRAVLRGFVEIIDGMAGRATLQVGRRPRGGQTADRAIRAQTSGVAKLGFLPSQGCDAPAEPTAPFHRGGHLASAVQRLLRGSHLIAGGSPGANKREST